MVDEYFSLNSQMYSVPTGIATKNTFVNQHRSSLLMREGALEE